MLVRNELYHDTTLAGEVKFTSSWQVIDISELAKVERDRQMVGFLFNDPYWIDFDNAELKNEAGEILRLEVRIVTEGGKIYQTYFGNARGKRLISYRPDTPLDLDDKLKKLEFRCDLLFEAKKVVWTTYSFKDMK